MLRPLRLVKSVPGTNESPAALTPPLSHSSQLPANISAYVVSVACRHQNRGLSLAQLVAAGEEGWQRAQRHHGSATKQLDRWGSWWVRQSILMALNAPLTDGPDK